MEMIENVSEDFHLQQPPTVTNQAARLPRSGDISIENVLEWLRQRTSKIFLFVSDVAVAVQTTNRGSLSSDFNSLKVP